MSPGAQSDGHDRPRPVGELVPSMAAVVEDVLVRSEDAIGQPIVAHVLPDVLDRVELWRFCRQRHQGDVIGDHELVREMPAGAISTTCVCLKLAELFYEPGVTWQCRQRAKEN